MPRALVLLVLFIAWVSAYAEVEKIATLCDKGFCFYCWPKLPNVKGWHHDRDQSLFFNINAQVPDGKTFADAETIIYANVLFKIQNPEAKTLHMLINIDHQQFRSDFPNAEIQEVKPLVTADGKTLRSFTYSSTEKNSWEQASFGEEREFYLIFTVSSRTPQGFSEAFSDYKKFINSYKSVP